MEQGAEREREDRKRQLHVGEESILIDGNIQSVSRSIDVLFALTRGPRTLSEVAAATKLSKATALRILRTLCARSLVAKESASTTYILGPGCLQLVEGVTAGLGVVLSADNGALTELWSLCRETVSVHVRVGYQRVCVAELPSPQAIRYTASVGASEPIHAGSAGKTLLAFMPEHERDTLLERVPRIAKTPATITDKNVLERELVQIAARGWATSRGERIEGAVGVSAPARLGKVLVAISVIGPAARMSPKRVRELIPIVCAAADELTRSYDFVGG